MGSCSPSQTGWNCGRRLAAKASSKPAEMAEMAGEHERQTERSPHHASSVGLPWTRLARPPRRPRDASPETRPLLLAGFDSPKVPGSIRLDNSGREPCPLANALGPPLREKNPPSCMASSVAAMTSKFNSRAAQSTLCWHACPGLASLGDTPASLQLPLFRFFRPLRVSAFPLFPPLLYFMIVCIPFCL